MKRKVNVIWNGDGADGDGFFTVQSGAFNRMPYSFKSRFENDDGELGTNPEELIVSALASCFNMKLAFVLNEAGFKPKELNTNGLLIFKDGSITSIELSVKAIIPKLNEDEFNKLAEVAKNNCPVSGLLNCKILLSSSLL